MNLVVDTSILVDHLRGDERAHKVLQQAMGQRDRRVTASVLTKVEVLAGMRQNERPATQRLLSLLEWVPVDDAIAERAGEMANRYLRSHPGVDPVDFVVAATAESLSAELWTRNLKHFPMLRTVRDPYGR